MIAALADKYKKVGYGRQLIFNDSSLIRRLSVHLQHATPKDLEVVVMQPASNNTRALYCGRFVSIYRSLIELEMLPNYNPALKLPKIRKRRTQPRPLTHAEASVLITQANLPQRHWFMLSCFAGLRAGEISQVRGVDLEESNDGHMLRVPYGKGGTDLVVPAHPMIVEMIQSYKTLDRLWPTMKAHSLSVAACKEMRRLGVKKKLHSGRHYFATSAYAASNGDLLAVSKLMRHASVATTQIYAELGSQVARSLVNSLPLPDLPKEQNEPQNT